MAEKNFSIFESKVFWRKIYGKLLTGIELYPTINAGFLVGPVRDFRYLDDLEVYEQRIQYFYQDRYRAVWKELFLTDLWNKISWHMNLYDPENARLLKKNLPFLCKELPAILTDRPRHLDCAELLLFFCLP